MMEIVWFITWSVAPADCLISGGVLALHREGIVVATKISTIDIVTAVVSRMASIAIAV